MKVTTLSKDSYLLTAFNEILSDYPLNGIGCCGNLIIIDMIYPTDINVIRHQTGCHIIFLTDNEMIFRVDKTISFQSDTYYLSRKGSISEFISLIKKTFDTIMLKKCFWRGVRYPLPSISINFLSERESEVFPLIGKGYDDKQIAHIMGCNYKTISTYRSTMLRKIKTRKGHHFANFFHQYTTLKKIHTLQCDHDYKDELTVTDICRKIAHA